ncbi:MAG TPA: hypothetical protein VIL05_08950 [Thermoclostridium sp.]
MSDNDLKLAMQNLANEAFGLADYFKIKLDYSEDSVANLETFCRLVHSLTKLKPEVYNEEVIQKTARYMGAYLGELIIRNLGGEWEIGKGKGISVRNGVFACSPIWIYHDKIKIKYRNL